MPERVRNISDFALICDIEPAEPEMNTIIHENTSTTAVRMAVATSESVLRMPHLARIAVRAAKTAENTAAVSHINKTSFYEFSHPAEIVPAGFGIYAALAAEFLLVHFSYSSAAAFLYEMRIWHGANITAAAVRIIERSITPLKIKIIDGIIESASARKTLLFLKQIAHIRQ